jgi:hypothetical protein
MNPLEPLLTVGLTKLTFELYFKAQNFKSPNTKLIIYKYSYFIMS